MHYMPVFGAACLNVFVVLMCGR